MVHSRRLGSNVVVAMLIGLVHVASSASSAERPNVVLIMTDDQGYGDLGVTGNPVIRTPNIDALARQSASLSNFYVSPVCAPTRACLMTGRYNYRTRVVDTWVGRAMMEPGEITVAELLRDAGYSTGIFGKWHLGDNYPMRANDQGFDESLVIRGGGLGQPSDPPENKNRYTDAILFHNGKQIESHGYCTDVYFNTALDWIDKCHAEGRNFFAYLPTNAPHGPFHDVPEALYREYKQLDLAPLTTRKNLGPQAVQRETDSLARIYAMITNIDENVGRLLRKLDELQLAANTIVIFMVDNGPNSPRFVSGLRGKKSEVYEGGIRSPFFVRWPGVLEPGHSSDRIAAHIDVLPTLLAACGVEPPPGLHLDGRNLLPLLKGVDETWPDRTIFIQSHRGDVPVMYQNFAARNQQWKLVHPSGFASEMPPDTLNLELYDMRTDPFETHNVAKTHPDVVAKLKESYEEWFRNVSQTRPDNYAPPQIYIGTQFENPVVLTRQNWRNFSGSTWAPDSNGYWPVYVARDGNYDVRFHFSPAEGPGHARLQVGEEVQSMEIPGGATQCEFTSVSLSEGNTRLVTTITVGEKSRGAYQAEVTWR